MKKIYTALSLALLLGGVEVKAQVQFKLFDGFGQVINDINDTGTAISTSKYYNYNTDTWTSMEAETTGLIAINNDGNLGGTMFYDEENFQKQPAYKKDGIWKPIGWFSGSVPAESNFSMYKIS